MSTKKESKAMLNLVNKEHVTKEGIPRKITYNNTRKLWTTKTRDRISITAKSKNRLIEKLFHFYYSIPDFLFRTIFQKALQEKAETMNISENTIKRIQQDYHYFVTEALATANIQKITPVFLRKIIQSRTKELHPDRKRLKAFKGILNMVFKYAVNYDLIDKNPADAVDLRRYYSDCKVPDHSPEANIFSPEEIETIKAEVRHRMNSGHCDGYYINGYITLVAIETGMRVGELCALKWEDIKDGKIHIHAQQLHKIIDGTNQPYYEDSTKEEKRVSNGGRYFPVTSQLKPILEELKALQKHLGLESEFVFCNLDGNWVKTNKYTIHLQRMLRSLDLECKATRNHAFRKTYNTNVLCAAGVPAPDRAALLGHSVETNERNYTFKSRQYLQNALEKIEALYGNQMDKSEQNQ